MLVFVLWALALLSFLGLQVAVASRLRAWEALGAWDQLQRAEALRSVLRYYAVSGKNNNAMRPGIWYRWFVGGQEVWVSLEKESSKIQVVEANDARLRQALTDFLPLSDPREVDELVDALLDWQDADDLVRLHGAEAEWYLQRGLPPPTNRPFASLCEIQKVRGVSPELFWGDPLEEAYTTWEQEDVGGETDMIVPERRSLADLLTVVGSKAERVTVLMPYRENVYEVAVVVGKAGTDGWVVADRCHGFVMSGFLSEKY
ncbi:MAG: hypothetical protein WHS86_10390 [Desulfosoma sp.]